MPAAFPIRVPSYLSRGISVYHQESNLLEEEKVPGGHKQLAVGNEWYLSHSKTAIYKTDDETDDSTGAGLRAFQAFRSVLIGVANATTPVAYGQCEQIHG